MKLIKGIILCEGITDKVLLGSYMQNVHGWVYSKKYRQEFFPKDDVDWYTNRTGEIVGIWAVGGCNFVPAINRIMRFIKIDNCINRIAVISDHDDEESGVTRSQEVFDEVNKVLGVKDYDEDCYKSHYNEWLAVDFIDGFGEPNRLHMCYLEVPRDSQGALETFMLDELSKNDTAKEEVIIQVKQFLKELKSEVYLKKRRDRIKADLSVSVSIFVPDRMFDTLIELIGLVDWKQFNSWNEQFGELDYIWAK